MENPSANTTPIENITNILFGSDLLSSVIQALYMTICLLLSMAGNSLVIATIVKTKELHSTTYYIQLTLAIFNLLFSVVTLPTAIFVLSRKHVQLSNFWCQAQGSVIFTSGTASMMLYTLTSMDRFVCIQQPLKYQTSSWVKYPSVCISVTVILVFILGLIPLIKQQFMFHEGLMVCTLAGSFHYRHMTYVTMTGTVIFIVCLFTLIITQVSIFITARSKTKFITHLGGGETNSRTLQALKAHVKALKPISLTILIFTLTWLAYSAIIIIDKKSNNFLHHSTFKATSRAICQLFITLPQCCNCIIYTFFDTSFCVAIKKLAGIRTPALGPPALP